MAIATIQNPSTKYWIDQQNAEEILDTVLSITVDPIKNLAAYLFPFIGTFTSRHFEIRREDESQSGMISGSAKVHIFEEFDLLKHAAGLQRSVGLYSSVGHSFSSYGGWLSLTAPIICVPFHHLVRTGKSSFGEERPEDALSQETWNYTDDETRFLMLRELAHVNANGSLFRISAKVIFIAVLFFSYALPVPFLAAGALILIAARIYIESERILHKALDRKALEALSVRLNNPERAKEAAISSLRKQLLQNQQRRRDNLLCGGYISEEGDNYLDLSHPSLTSRIRALSQ